MGLIITGSRRMFNISSLVGGHPILDPYILMSEANRTLGILLNLLQSASSLPGSLTITVVNWWVLILVGHKCSFLFSFLFLSRLLKSNNSLSHQFLSRYEICKEYIDRKLGLSFLMWHFDINDCYVEGLEKVHAYFLLV